MTQTKKIRQIHTYMGLPLPGASHPQLSTSKDSHPPSLPLPLSVSFFSDLSFLLPPPVAGVELLISTAMNTLPEDGEGGREHCVHSCLCVGQHYFCLISWFPVTPRRRLVLRGRDKMTRRNQRRRRSRRNIRWQKVTMDSSLSAPKQQLDFSSSIELVKHDSNTNNVSWFQ